MNKQLIQAIMYGHIVSVTSKDILGHKTVVPLKGIPGDEVSTMDLPELKFPLTLSQEELLDVLVNTLSDVLAVYTKTTIPIGVAGPFPVTATFQNLTSI